MKCIKYVLDNGMTIVLIPIKYTEIISIGFFIKVGAKEETKDNNGIAHFLEHMMFSETKKRSQSQMVEILDNLGAEYNAVTTMEHTYYYINGRAVNTKKILDIILDIYINPIIKQNKINTEAKVIIEELRMRSDIPSAKLYDKLHEKYFGDTNLGRSIIGTEQSILNLKQTDFIDFKNKYYTPENTVFVIAGNFNPKEIFPMVERVLSPLPNPIKNVLIDDKNKIIKYMETQDSPYVFIKKDPSMLQAYVLLTFPLHNLFKTNELEINIISHLLSTGFSSRLMTKLRLHNGRTYSLSAGPLVYKNAGIFVIKMVIHPDELIAGIKNVLKELKKIKTNIMDLKEYKKVMNIIKFDSIFTSNQPIDWLVYFGLHFLYNDDFNPVLKNNENITRRINRKDILNISKKIFIRNKINLFMYGNIIEDNYDFMKL